MQSPPRSFSAYLSEHRFWLMLLACALALILMLGVIHATVGVGPIGARFDAPAG